MLAPRDVAALDDALDYLTGIRIDLHLAAGRAADDLTRQEQQRLAETRGLAPPPGLLPVEVFMREYFRHTHAVVRIAENVKARAVRRPRRGSWVSGILGHRVDDRYLVGPTTVAVLPARRAEVAASLPAILRLLELSQAYGYWLAQKGNVRKVQGRLSDMGMLLAIHARRDAETGKFTAESLELLETIARWMRLYHMLFWASQVRPARGDNAVSYSLLRTEVGLRGLLERGALTEREFSLLMDDTAVSETKRHSAVLEWIMARFIDARYTGMLQGNAGLDARFLEEGCKLRAVCGNIADDAAAPMPLSYVHLVQLLVDTLVVLAPYAQYP
jgi:hypothetical protein